MKTKKNGDRKKKDLRDYDVIPSPIAIEELNNVNEESDQANDSDVEFIAENDQYANFIVSLNESSLEIDKKTFSKELKVEKDPVEVVRRLPSTTGWEKESANSKQRLPIKDKKGLLKPNKHFLTEDAAEEVVKTQENIPTTDEINQNATNEVHEEESSVYDSADDITRSGYDSDVSGANGNVNAANQNTVISRKLNIAEKKVFIAQLCESILEDPEAALFRPKTQLLEVQKKDHSSTKALSKIEELHGLTFDENITIQNLATISEFAIFKDIIPNYRIRIITAKEEEQRASKDVMKVRASEKALLASYQNFLKRLEELASTIKNDGKSRALSLNAVRCMCGLLKTHAHFNFRTNLIMAIIPRINHDWSEMSDLCYNCIVGIFQNDKQGEVSLEITKAITKFAKDRKYVVKDQVLRCFNHLPLKVREDEISDVKAAAKNKRRKRKAKDIEYEMMETDANVDTTVKSQCHADALEEVVLTFFRVLKSYRLPHLLPVVMEGLAKFAHLINLDTVEDLLDVLKELLSENKLSFEASLHCVLMSFSTLQGPGRELQVDDKIFLRHLYGKLPLLVNHGHRNLVPLTLQCLEAAFMKRRENSAVRVAAFMKQLLTISLHFSYAEATLLLNMVNKLALRYTPTQQILENELDKVTSGNFNPYIQDPDHANPYASSSWDLSLLRFSYHTNLRSIVGDIGKLTKQNQADALSASFMRNTNGISTTAAIFAGIPVPSVSAVKIGNTSRPIFPIENQLPYDSDSL